MRPKRARIPNEADLPQLSVQKRNVEFQKSFLWQFAARDLRKDGGELARTQHAERLREGVAFQTNGEIEAVLLHPIQKLPSEGGATGSNPVSATFWKWENGFADFTISR